MKRLYIVAGGTDGYVNISFTFDGELAVRVIDNNPESYGGMDSGPSSILVPDDATYESLGITYPLEEDDEDYEDEEDDE